MGFIAYNSEVIILQKYVKGSFSMSLISIQSPVVNVVTQVDQLAKDFANDILKAMTPKGKVALKKMEPAKFAVVKSKYPVLALLENYDPTQAGSVKKPITETYEYRVGTNSPNPPSLIDCLTADLKVIYNQKTNFGLISLPETVTNKTLPSEVAKKLLGVYQSYDYMQIPGYRPWSNRRFINSLTEEKRNQLALELQGYIADYGFTE